MKVLLIVIAILILTIIVLALIIKSQNNKLKQKDTQITNLIENGKIQEIRINSIMGELEIEKKNNEKLAKKLSDISCMSIDNVLQQLQNNKG